MVRSNKNSFLFSIFPSPLIFILFSLGSPGKLEVLDSLKQVAINSLILWLLLNAALLISRQWTKVRSAWLLLISLLGIVVIDLSSSSAVIFLGDPSSEQQMLIYGIFIVCGSLTFLLSSLVLSRAKVGGLLVIFLSAIISLVTLPYSYFGRSKEILRNIDSMTTNKISKTSDYKIRSLSSEEAYYVSFSHPLNYSPSTKTGGYEILVSMNSGVPRALVISIFGYYGYTPYDKSLSHRDWLLKIFKATYPPNSDYSQVRFDDVAFHNNKFIKISGFPHLWPANPVLEYSDLYVPVGFEGILIHVNKLGDAVVSDADLSIILGSLKIKPNP